MMSNKGKNIIKTLLFLMVVVATSIGAGTTADAKVIKEKIKITKTLYDDGTWTSKDTIYWSKEYVGLKTANGEKIKRQTVKISKKGVLKKKKSKSGKTYKYVPNKAGKTILTVKGYTSSGKLVFKCTKKITIKSSKAQAKKAVKLQNKYRKNYGVSSLKWSETLYQLGQYRFESSGMDKHKNIEKDYSAFFGVDYCNLYIKYPELSNDVLSKGPSVNENLSTSIDPIKTVKSWKKSVGHYDTMTRKVFKTVAIYSYGDYGTIGIYSAYTENELKSMLQEKESRVAVTLRRYDSSNASYQKGCYVYYYEKGNKWDTFLKAHIIDVAGTEIYLEVGKTYVFYEDESKSPSGCEKAEKITVTITKDTKEIILKS